MGQKNEVLFDKQQVPDVLMLKAGRSDDERVFERIPKHLDVQSYRRDSAKARYLRHAPNRELPPMEKARLSPKDYDRDAAKIVTESLGHHRRSIILSSYIR